MLVCLATVAPNPIPNLSPTSIQPTPSLKHAQYAAYHPSRQDQLLDLAASTIGSAEQVVGSRVSKFNSKSILPQPPADVTAVAHAAINIVQNPSTVVSNWQRVQPLLPFPLDKLYEQARDRYFELVDESPARRVQLSLPRSALDVLAIQGEHHPVFSLLLLPTVKFCLYP